METGLKYTLDFIVDESLTARHVGSGSAGVLSTPMMIAYMEGACLKCVQPQLEEGYTTVGTAVNIRHLAATNVGEKVTVECELTEVDRRRLTFRVEAKTERGLIGEGTHERFIVDAARFGEKK